jgi:hypothetical protein
MKHYYCKICNKELIPRHKLPRKYKNINCVVRLHPLRVILHHVDYINRIAIIVCEKCHYKLHNDFILQMYNKYGNCNIIWLYNFGATTINGPHKRYPKLILE